MRTFADATFNPASSIEEEIYDLYEYNVYGLCATALLRVASVVLTASSSFCSFETCTAQDLHVSGVSGLDMYV